MACGAAAATMAKNRAMPMASIFFFFSARPKCAGAFKTPSTCSGEIECLHDGHDFYRHDLDQAARADEETAAKNCARCYFPRADPKKVQNEESFPRNEMSVLQQGCLFFFFSNARRAKSVISAPRAPDFLDEATIFSASLTSFWRSAQRLSFFFGFLTGQTVDRHSAESVSSDLRWQMEQAREQARRTAATPAERSISSV